MNKERIESNLAAYRGGIRTFKETVRKFDEIVRSVYEENAEIAKNSKIDLNQELNTISLISVKMRIAEAILKAGGIEG